MAAERGASMMLTVALLAVAGACGAGAPPSSPLREMTVTRDPAKAGA